MSACIKTGYALTNYGYGKMKYKGKTEQHHRVVYAKHHNVELASLAGLVVMHTCDNKWCVNPEHLVLGTHQNNMDDMVSKQRHMHGITHVQSKLTEADVIAIRAANNTQKELAAAYGVSFQTISDIQRRITWQHI